MVVAAGHIGIGYQMHAMLRGNENSFLDLNDSDYTRIMINRIVDFTAEYIKAVLEAADGLIDVVRADEDMGTMDRLLISPEMWREYYKPGFKQIFEIVHSYGARVWMHSCGYIAPLLEDFIQIGADCWNPLPPYVKGNEPENVKRICRGRISLDGGVNHKILISGTKADVRNATRHVLDTFAPEGGLLIGPSQVLTEDMPSENIIEMFKTALEYQ
jgi:uroporphyrinogen decarboxylase